MNSVKKSDLSAVVLSGGKSSRMHYKDKGLILLNNQPLILHVINAIKNNVNNIFISANNNQDIYRKLTNRQVISDVDNDYKGPLAGIHAIMLQVKTPYLLVVPNDSPFINYKLITKFCKFIDNNDIAVARDKNRLQPAFALIKTSLKNSLKKYLNTGGRKLDLWYQQHNMIKITFASDIFLNINSPEDYEFAKKIIKNK